MNPLLADLKTLKDKLEKLALQMSDPEVLRDRARYQGLAVEHSRTAELVEKLSALDQLEREMEESNELLEDEELREEAREDLHRLEAEKSKREDELRRLLLPKDPMAGKDLILEIRAGTGGEEAALFVSVLLQMYLRFAERKKFRTEVLTQSPTPLGGFREVLVEVSGKEAHSSLKFESGTHRVQRVPVTESSGRIHTSAVTVAVLPEPDDVEVKIDPSEIRVDRFRSTGPGGQSVNTTDSAVRITHIPTGLVVSCQDEKSQLRNKERAMRVLRARLYDNAIHQQQQEIASARRSMVGTGDRSERIRTYNFPQNRVTDHRIGLTLYKLDTVLQGDMDEISAALLAHEEARLLDEVAGTKAADQPAQKTARK
ncbi:MAG: peptide chain release factor 1 [Candidatus Coatesbacteria bacterium]|nr:peptide chain release factor 1 [Candidatus Coatesbacteria bacterium]